MTKPSAIKADQTVPDFTLPDSAGTPHQLSELTRERPCIVIFYRGHW